LLKRSFLAMVLLALVIGAFVYRAAPTPLQEYALNDVAYYVYQLRAQPNSSLQMGFNAFTNFLQKITGLDSLNTIRASKLVFIFGLVVFFFLARFLTKSVALSVLASFVFVFNAYQFNLITVALRQMFAGIFMAGFTFACTKFLGALDTSDIRKLKPKFKYLLFASFLFGLIAFSHEITFLVATVALFIFLLVVFAAHHAVERRPLTFLAAMLGLAFVGINAFRTLMDLVLPAYFNYSTTIYGLYNLSLTMYPSKLGLIVFVSSIILTYAIYAYLHSGRTSSFQQKLVFWLGCISLLLLVFPVSWTFPGIVYLIGFYFVFYYFHGLLSRKPSSAELFVIALFVSASFLSRNAVLGLDFFMYRFESELILPLVILAIFGFKEFSGDYRLGRLSLPIVEWFKGINFSLGLKLIVSVFLLTVFASNLYIIGFKVSDSSDLAKMTEYKTILESDSSGYLKDFNAVATDEITSLYPPHGENFRRLTGVWKGNIKEAISYLKSFDIRHVIVAGEENANIINFGQTTDWIKRKYSHLRNPNFDKVFDAGPVTVYKLDFDGKNYYADDNTLQPFVEIVIQ